MTPAPAHPARLLAPLVLLVLTLATLLAAPASAQPAFPELTGRVVDQGRLLSTEKRTELTGKLEALEQQTGDQLVVVTLRSLEGYDIADYGYQLGRAWGIGRQGVDNGVLLIVAPEERKVRIEVGYGLEPVLTDAMSAQIIQNDILPAFRNGGFERGITQGVDAISAQLTADRAEAEARAARAAEAMNADRGQLDLGAIVILMVILFLVLTTMGGVLSATGRRRRRRDGLAPVIIWAASEALRNSSRGGRGGGGFGGGGFSGGGGSFGGGGASGGW